MRGRTLVPVSRAAASAVALAACCLALALPAEAQTPHVPDAPDGRDAVEGRDAPRVRLATTGVYSSYQPRVEVHLSRAAHVAVFEVEPEVGALRTYPFPSGRSVRLEAGTHTYRLNGVRATNLREQFLSRLGHRLQTRVGHYPEAYLVAVASERPLRISALSGGRVFAYRGTGAGGGSVGVVVAALLEEVLPEVGASDWSYDLHSYSKYRDPGLVAGAGSFGGPYAELGMYGCLGYGAGPLGFAGFDYLSGGFGGLGFGHGSYGRGLERGARSAALTMQIALSPVSATTCRGFGYLFQRLAFGFGGPAFDGPVVFRPHEPPHPEEPEEPAEEDGEERGPTVERYDGPLLEADVPADRAAVLRRIADARAEGSVTAEQVSGLVREGRLDLPVTVTERMRVEAFRHDRLRERRAREIERRGVRAWRDRRPLFASPRHLYRARLERHGSAGSWGRAFREGPGVHRRGPVFRVGPNRPGHTPSRARPAPSPRPRVAPRPSSSGRDGG